ncbi:MAG: NADH-quinone oxidoreductase subunit I [Bdellovibrionota bacterium]
MAIGVITVRRKPLGILESTYVVEIVRGLLTTGGQFVRNFLYEWTRRLPRVQKFLQGLSAVPLLGRLMPEERGVVTIDYPYERTKLPPNYRTFHRLMLHTDGSVRCTACMLCATNCPSQCIHIVASETEEEIEKKPERYDIDIMRCVFCGYCVEACPCDAIRMDSGIVDEAYYDRRVHDMNLLMGRGEKIYHEYDSVFGYGPHGKKEKPAGPGH